ncbi:MAG: NAD(P)H-hydrate dehydratase [Myxococcota bacterium]|nr:NAD(P)H-hydrate dehydratase [Myxococcota bacterium]
MTPVLSRAQMREFDTHAIERCCVSGALLMENAGRGATDVLVREWMNGDARSAEVAIVCGTGSNGGDGFVVARHLLARGAQPFVILAGDEVRMTGDARANFKAWRALGGLVHSLDNAENASADAVGAIHRVDVIVDALFGTGLARPIDRGLAELVVAMNASPARRFAIDLPSGLDADTGQTLGVAVCADATATFAHPKLGLLTPNGSKLAGRVHVVDIGVPPAIAEHLGCLVQRLDPEDLAQLVLRRSPGAYKTSAGHVVVVAGSPGKVGAPQLAARGAMRAGAGLATIATWPDAASAIESHACEAMTARIDPARSQATLDEILVGKQAVVVGPGFGLGNDARTVVEHLLASWHRPIVVDADALTMFAGRPGELGLARAAILTPHPGELARLLGVTVAAVEQDRFASARALVGATGAVVVLKGAHTIVAGPDLRVAVSPVSCPALATAGAGDVLSGVIAAMACTLPPFEAACAGVLSHALAGVAWSMANGGADRGMLASEIADELPRVLARRA